MELILDSQIRDWVLLPILIVTIVLALFRFHFARVFGQSSRKPEFAALRDTNILMRVRRLRGNANILPMKSFLVRRQYFNDKTHGILHLAPKPQSANPLDAMANPAASNSMVDMMKKNLANLITQPLMMSWVSYFFTGFVLVKLPFPLTPRFKSMFQRGIESLEGLDETYISSLSWYFVVLFGLMGVTSLIMGGEGEDVTAMVDPTTAAMMGAAQQASAPGQDMSTAFTAERENLELVQHAWIGKSVEERLLAMKL